ncbi:unnamed protein product (macronuclear) [Paramecium tetraurelia]|uniref:Uncharacterized protein n=1 Tax=Paramecium tetraurelia TaxID=5888 RepID=A0CI12_PARTE|nr:uncharacterized protein GSPATT00038532001 [Paramecium tetraurelia]CAK70429.1 unnamed protein product [Paramecium tetraurelia]|eukprot:XP_001437826.1 hypothetical protein (macronuclear) [Paramecium tetraurelia strain d4-2]
MSIPNLITESQVKTTSEQKGEVLILKLLLKTIRIECSYESDAIRVKERFNKTFIMMSKISVDFANIVDGPALPKVWSRHTPGSSAFQEIHNIQEPPFAKKMKEIKNMNEKQNKKPLNMMKNRRNFKSSYNQ